MKPLAITLIAVTLAMPCAGMADVFASVPTLYESKKLVRVNRVDRVSAKGELTWIEWPTGVFSSAGSIAPAFKPIDVPAPATGFSPTESEPAAIAFSSRVEPRRPKFDPRSFGKHNRPS
jgi:hypothetical protein